MADGPVEVAACPAGARRCVRAGVVPGFDPGPVRIPDTSAMVLGIQPDPRRLADYDGFYGFALRNHVPPTWLHVLTFPLHLTSWAGPARPSGRRRVHASNRMRLHRAVTATEVLDATVHVENLRPHRRGAQFDVVSEIRVADELVWDGVSTYFAPGAKVDGVVSTGSTSDGSRRARPTIPSNQVRPIATWSVARRPGGRLPARLGDPNPIHTSRLAARAFGFARPISHWTRTHAHLLAALEPRLPLHMLGRRHLQPSDPVAVKGRRLVGVPRRRHLDGPPSRLPRAKPYRATVHP